MLNKLHLSLIATAVLFSTSALSALPQGYPADYQKVVDAATKEGKLVVYSTTDTKAAGPLIQGFEATYPGIKVEYNDMNSTELYTVISANRPQAAAAATWSGVHPWIPR